MTPAENDIVIRVEQLTAGYGDEIVLDSVSFEIRRGEIFGILGDSGSGKSTLVKHMIGLMHPRSGHVYIDDEEITAADDATLKRITMKIGVTYQSGALFGSMSLLENICLPLEELTTLPPDARELIAEMKLKLVGLEEHADHLPAEVSGGMKKRASIARAMALDPEIIFLDEPSAGLDPVTGAELDELILQLSRDLGITFVVITHELASIFAIADRIIMLSSETGTIIAEGNPHALRDTSEDPRVRRFFKRVMPSGQRNLGESNSGGERPDEAASEPQSIHGS